MIQAWLVVAPTSIFYTVYSVLFHGYGGSNVSVTNCMSHFSWFVSTKAIVELDHGNTGNSQVIGIILCRFPNCSIIYPVVSVYYCPGYPYNTISSGVPKFYVVFQYFTSEPLDNCDFVDPEGSSFRSLHKTQNNLYYIQIEVFKVTPQKDSNIVVPTFCAFSKQNLYHFIHHIFGCVSIIILKIMEIKVFMEGLPANIPDC